MGQYYLPTILTKSYKTSKRVINKQLYSWDFGCGLKLMEHSYVHNPLVRAVEYLLAQDKKGKPFVWAGDYADYLDGREENIYQIGQRLESSARTIKTMPLTTYKWRGFDYCDLDPKFVKDYKYVINHTKKLYVVIPKHDPNKFTIHPLPLLTAESNGKGGGDYWSKKGAKHVGSWKYDTISVGDEVPKGFKRLNVRFSEAE